MPTKGTAAAFDLSDAVLNAFATNDRINAYLIDNISDEAWTMKPAGGKGRTIAAIIGHMHNVRLMWLKAAGYVGEMPEKLEEGNFSRKDAAKALAASCKAMSSLLRPSLASDGRIKGFKPDAASFFGYLVAHDAHHRGQIAMLARQLGLPLSKSVGFGIWEWGTR
jgi:uncharacterized damage-inducible protein DinB